MQPDTLKVSILSENSDAGASVAKILRGMPHIQVKISDSQYSVSSFLENVPDLIIVVLEEENLLPDWLADLTHGLPRTVIMVCSHSHDKDFLLRAMQLGVREFIPLPPDPEDLAAALERLRSNKEKHFPGGSAPGRIIAVAGLRGGVGATTIAVNLAVHLAEMFPRRVAIADLGRPFSNVAKLLDQDKKGSRNIMDLVRNENLLDSNFILKILHSHDANLAVLHGFPHFQDLEAIDPSIIQKIWGLFRNSFDWIVVDLGHWVDELYANTLQEADQLLLITEITVPDLKNLRQLLALLQQWGVPNEKIGIVANRYFKDNGLKLKDLEAIQKQPIFFSLPSDFRALNQAINDGVPLNKVAPRSKLCRSFQGLAEELVHRSSVTLADATSLPAHKGRRRFLFF